MASKQYLYIYERILIEFCIGQLMPEEEGIAVNKGPRKRMEPNEESISLPQSPTTSGSCPT